MRVCQCSARAAGIEDEVVIFVWLFNEWQTGYGVKDGLARCRRKDAIGAEPLATPWLSTILFIQSVAR